MTYQFTLRTAAAIGLALACALPAQAAPVSGQGTWETTLQARDINADGTVDAWYDTVRDVSWLADAKAIRGTVFDDGFDTNDGRVTYASATSWVATLNVSGVTGWRLPDIDIQYLYQDTLGNQTAPFGPLRGWTNTGPFDNVADFGVSGWYWRGTAPEVEYPRAQVWTADGTGAYFYSEPVTNKYGAWAVKSGDIMVSAVPEIETWAMMLAGLGLMGAVARRRKAKQA
jgi:hypothetical protein